MSCPSVHNRPVGDDLPVVYPGHPVSFYSPRNVLVFRCEERFTVRITHFDVWPRVCVKPFASPLVFLRGSRAVGGPGLVFVVLTGYSFLLKRSSLPFNERYQYSNKTRPSTFV